MSHLAAKKRESQASKPWAIIVPPEFFEYDLTDREAITFLVLDMIAKMDAFCFPSYETVAEYAKKTPRAIREIIPELERKGFVRVSHVASKKSRRVGIILLRRVNPATPAADTPEAIKSADLSLRQRRKRPKSTEIRQPDHPNPRKSSIDLALPDTKDEQRVSLPGTCESSLAFVPVVDSAPDPAIVGGSDSVPVVGGPDDGMYERAVERMIEIAYRLSKVDRASVKPLVEEFADVSLIAVWDTPNWRPSHCGYAWAVHRGHLPPVAIDSTVRRFVEKHENGELTNPAGWYRDEIGGMTLIDAPEHINN